MNDKDFKNATNLAVLRAARSMLDLATFTDAARREKLESLGRALDAMIDKLHWECTE